MMLIIYIDALTQKHLLFEKMPVDFKLLSEHDFASILNDECFRV